MKKYVHANLNSNFYGLNEAENFEGNNIKNNLQSANKLSDGFAAAAVADDKQENLQNEHEFSWNF